VRRKTQRLLEQGKDLKDRANLEIGPTGPKVAFAESALAIVDDVMIDFQARHVLYEESQFEAPHLVNGSLNDMRKQCVDARKNLSGTEPTLSEPLDRIEQVCGRFVHRHPAPEAQIADLSKPLAPNVLDDLLELRLKVAEVVDEIYRQTGLPSAQQLFNRIEFDAAPESPWPGRG
jgi:hypothetical protein